ncbi:MAG: hypothetical protein F2667_06385, partial [Actinobacteria bacterium]|nr:hypothetical protein [Actinomycetota bacterium]
MPARRRGAGPRDRRRRARRGRGDGPAVRGPPAASPRRWRLRAGRGRRAARAPAAALHPGRRRDRRLRRHPARRRAADRRGAGRLLAGRARRRGLAGDLDRTAYGGGAVSDLREALDWAARSPLLLLLVTLGGYQLGCWVRDRTGGHALAQPVVVAVGLVGLTITVLDVSYTDYLADVDLITFWLGPATVALAVPLHRQSHRLRGFVAPLVVTVLAGAVVSVTTVVVLVRVLGGSEVLARTMAPKAATTPVSIALSESLGGLPA